MAHQWPLRINDRTLGSAAWLAVVGHERVLAYGRNGEAEFRMNEYFATLEILVVGTTAFSGLLSLLRRHLLRWQLTELGRAH